MRYIRGYSSAVVISVGSSSADFPQMRLSPLALN